MVTTKATIVEVIKDEESISLTLENVWLPQEHFRLCLSYGDDFEVGQEVKISVEIADA